MNTASPILTDSAHRCSMPDEARSSVALPLLATALLHTAIAAMLWQGWAPASPSPAAQAPSLRTQLVALPAPQPEPIVEPPAAAPPPVAEAPPPKPVVDEAAIARKRLEQEQEQEQQRQRELRQQQEATERERERAEQQRLAEAAAAEQQRRDELARQQAQAQAHAAAEAARVAAEQQYRPINKPEPDYPRRALTQKLEGDCTVEYDVTASGRVDNPRLVDGACDSPLFARPSLAAARDFIYQPRLVDGQPVTVAGVRNTFRYRLSQ